MLMLVLGLFLALPLESRFHARCGVTIRNDEDGTREAKQRNEGILLARNSDGWCSSSDSRLRDVDWIGLERCWFLFAD
ncbi:hypothetical protein R1flu_024762 [Riccia fluitans]|uniref:Secreted protein n=1 Tax=Riccia fluitans TaxID=41844 RepID=A0ABD1XVU4_9MARC